MKFAKKRLLFRVMKKESNEQYWYTNNFIADLIITVYVRTKLKNTHTVP